MPGTNLFIFLSNTQTNLNYEAGFRQVLKDKDINILSVVDYPEYNYENIAREFVSASIDGYREKYYVHGPVKMLKAVQHQLEELQNNQYSIINKAF